IRRAQPALQHLRTLRFHDADAPGLLCFSKTDPLGVGDPILVVINVDERQRHAGQVHVDPATFGLGLGDDDEFELEDLLGGGTYRWRGWHNYVDLTPGRGAAHVFAVRSVAPNGQRSGVIPDLDLHLLAQGTHRRLHEQLGAQPVDGGTRFAVWAPSARALHVIGDFDGWGPGVGLEPQGTSGVWAGIVETAGPGTTYR